MKEISVSVNTINEAEKNGTLYRTVSEALESLKYGGKMMFSDDEYEVCKVYEMGDINRRFEYNAFRGYFVSLLV